MSFLVNSFFQNAPALPTFVGGRSGSFIDGGGGNISLTSLTGGVASAPAENDLVVVCLTTGSTANRSVANSSGYTSLASLGSDDSFDAQLRAGYKFMGSIPDTSIAVTGTGNVTDGMGFVVHVWRNINLTTPLDVAVTTAAGIDSAQANPPAITPVTAGAIILAIGGDAGGTLAAYTGPAMGSGLDYFFTGWGADTQDGLSGIYAKTDWSSGSFDPPAFSGGGGATTSAWCACTVALRPA